MPEDSEVVKIRHLLERKEARAARTKKNLTILSIFFAFVIGVLAVVWEFKRKQDAVDKAEKNVEESRNKLYR